MPSAFDWAIIIAPTITGSISLLSSVWLIRIILRPRTFTDGINLSRLPQAHRRGSMAAGPPKKPVRDRLVVGLSIMDIVFSLACIQSTFSGPTYLNSVEEILDRYHLTGNWATCQIQGFLFLIGQASPLYNAGLCIYFYLSVCKTVSEEKMRKYVEPAIHSAVWIYGIGSAIVAESLNTIAFAGYQGCFIFDPHGGREDAICLDQAPNNSFPECKRDDFRAIFMIAFMMGLPHLFTIISIAVFMSLIYRRVRKVERKASQWMMNRHRQGMSNSGFLACTKPTPRTSVLRAPSCSDKGSARSASVSDTSGSDQRLTEVASLHPPVPEMTEENFPFASADSPANGGEPEDTEATASESNCKVVEPLEIKEEVPSFSPPLETTSKEARRSSQVKIIVETATSNTARSPNSPRRMSVWAPDRRRSSVANPASPTTQMANRISETGIAYVLAYACTYIFVLIQIFVNGGTKDPSVLQLLSSIFMPLQGLFNFLAFTLSKVRLIQDNTRRGSTSTMSTRASFLRAAQIR